MNNVNKILRWHKWKMYMRNVTFKVLLQRKKENTFFLG